MRRALSKSRQWVLTALRTGGDLQTVKQLGARLAQARDPLKPRTIQTALGELEAAGLAAGSEEGNGRARYWSPTTPNQAYDDPGEGGERACDDPSSKRLDRPLAGRRPVGGVVCWQRGSLSGAVERHHPRDPHLGVSRYPTRTSSAVSGRSQTAAAALRPAAGRSRAVHGVLHEPALPGMD
jgi:hypothetical protein